MEWAAFNTGDSRGGGLVDDAEADAETQKRKRRTAEAEETRIAGSYERAIRLVAELDECDANDFDGNNGGEMDGGEGATAQKEKTRTSEAKREEAKQTLLAVVNHEMMRVANHDELTPTLCSVKKLALRNLGNIFAKECGEFEGNNVADETMNEDDDDENKEEDEKQRQQAHSFEQAIRCYSEAVKMDPEDVSSWLRMGELSTKRGDVALARIAFESGLLVQPTHALLLNKLCEVCVLVGDEVTAKFLAGRILNLDRKNERMKEIRTNFANVKPKEWLTRAREKFERVNAKKETYTREMKHTLSLERMAWDDVASTLLDAVKVRVELEEDAIRAKTDDDDDEDDDGG